jgi:chromosome transmission fidelity protein 18
MSRYSPGITSSFDPALLDFEYENIQAAPSSHSFSDDFEALQQCIAEDRAKKTTQGVVIQHRAWNVAEVFRSEGEISIGTSS